jgi:hypothetical protein
MAFYSGLNGQLYLNGSKIGKVQNWSLNASQAVLETTSLEDTDRTLINGVRSMSGSCRVFYHSDGNASDFINNIIKSGASGAEDGVAIQSEPVLFKLHVDSTKYIEVYAWITGASMSMSVGEVFSVDVTFEVTGHAKTETV